MVEAGSAGASQMCKHFRPPRMVAGNSLTFNNLRDNSLVPTLLLLNPEKLISASWLADNPPLQIGRNAMKKILFVLCLALTTVAVAQNNVGGNSLNSQVQSYSFSSHPQHAAYAPMSQEQNILASSSYSSASGDRPASDFPQPESVSLGVAARELREQHAPVKKARVVWINQ